MEFSELSEEHIKFKEEVREYAEQSIAPVASKISKEEHFPVEIIREMAEKGWLGTPFPEEYGGMGKDNLSYAIEIEEISRVCASTGITLAAHISLASYPVFAKGTEEQKKKYLIPLARGKKIGSFGLTEPNAGSDAAGTETMAVKEGNEWIINGSKRFITNGSYADVIVFTATEDRSKRSHGINAFIVEKGTDGFSQGRKEDKMGLRGSNTAELIFDNCKLSDENRLGERFDGFKVFMETLDGGRISIGALALGIAQGAFDKVVEWIKKKSDEGLLLKKNQYIQRTIADIGTEIEAARHLIYGAAYKKDKGENITKEGAMAKLYASEIGTKAVMRAIDIMGYDGLTEDFPVERYLRDIKLMEVGEGTSEIQRIVISRQILGR